VGFIVKMSSYYIVKTKCPKCGENLRQTFGGRLLCKKCNIYLGEDGNKD